MAKVDLHVHSRFSEQPSDWILRRVGSKESYTEPEHIYRLAKARGMDFIAITDHNRINGALLLKEKYPDEIIVGVEATVSFPEDDCKIHLLMYGITMNQFEEIQKLRSNIYLLRNFIIENEIAYSVAHATYSVNKKIDAVHLEKLILLFDVFEGINGGRNYYANKQWMELMKKLTPEHIEKLYHKYRIKPISDMAWIKSFTAGSDDHAGLFVGNTYTEINAKTVNDVVKNIKTKQTTPKGNNNNFKNLAFTIYKVGFDFAKASNYSGSRSFLFQITEKVFESESLNFKEKLMLHRMKRANRKKQDKITKSIIELIESVEEIPMLDMDSRLKLVFQKLTDISDEYLKQFIISAQQVIHNGNLGRLINSFSSSLMGAVLFLPFVSTLRHLNINRTLIRKIESRLNIRTLDSHRQILWFTDDLADRYDFGNNFESRKNDNNACVKFVTAKRNGFKTIHSGSDIIRLPSIYQFHVSALKSGDISVPSILDALELIANETPSEICISTPGPVGLVGLLLSRLLNVPCRGFYNSDFIFQIEKAVADNKVMALIDKYISWFYSKVDTLEMDKMHDNTVGKPESEIYFGADKLEKEQLVPA